MMQWIKTYMLSVLGVLVLLFLARISIEIVDWIDRTFSEPYRFIIVALLAALWVTYLVKTYWSEEQ